MTEEAEPLDRPDFLRPRTPHNAPIQLDLYNPEWPDKCEDVAGRIRSALGEAFVRLEHVGSTSVPGLSAKPIIDVVLTVGDPVDEAAYVPALTAAGFTLWVREPGWFEHRLLRGVEPSVNLHVFADSCEEVGRMLAFRDWLRSHDDDRRLYEARKRALAERTWTHVQDYADAKTEVVRAILERALGGLESGVLRAEDG
jgi:GrpB-like predicted nucleotidyltransferase (UPF0157 family)